MSPPPVPPGAGGGGVYELPGVLLSISNASLEFLSEVRHEGDAIPLPTHGLHDADDGDHENADLVGAPDERHAARYVADDEAENEQHHADHDLGEEEGHAVLRVPLHLGVVLLHEERDEGEDAEVGKDEHDRPVAALRPSRRWGVPARRRRVRAASRRWGSRGGGGGGRNLA